VARGSQTRDHMHIRRFPVPSSCSLVNSTPIELPPFMVVYLPFTIIVFFSLYIFARKNFFNKNIFILLVFIGILLQFPLQLIHFAG